MTVVEFFRCSDKTTAGFVLSGHSGMAQAGKDIVCAAVSSAAFLTANTVTEILGLAPEIECRDGYLKLVFTCKEQAMRAQDVIKGFELHMKNLEADYPDNVKVKYGGVKKCLK